MSIWKQRLEQVRNGKTESLEEKKKMDPVDKDELGGKHKDRKDKDIDNDGDVDSSDEYLHKKRKAVSKAIKNEETELDEAPQPKWKVTIGKKHYTVTARNTAEASRKAKQLAAKDKNFGVGGKIERMAESVELEELTKTQKRALQNVKAKPKSKVSLKKAPWEKDKNVKEAEGETKPCPKCEGSTENHSADCPTQKETKAKDDTAVVSPKAESKKWTVYKRIMEKTRAAQTAGATAPEEMDAKESEGSKEFVNQHESPPEDAVDVSKAIEKNLKTMSSDPIKHAPIRGGENRKEGK